MKGAWRIGTISGIPVQIHWSFSLILLWAVYSGSRSGGGLFIILSLVITLLLFLCVFLHELGHAFMAKQFGVSTRSITLLPIGGVAALDRIPERPREELLIAVAGPMVNVVIAAVLYVVQGWPGDPGHIENTLNWKTVGSVLFFMNVIMIVFNMIPAFPMDGGRIFRAFLAIWLPYAKATAIASAVGQGLAVIMIIVGLNGNPFLCLIGMMVFFGAKSENRWVHLRRLLEGVYVRDLMKPPQVVLSPDDPVSQCIEVVNRTGQSNFIVVEQDRIAGILSHKNWLRHLQDPESPMTVGMIMKLPTILVSTRMPAIDLFRMTASSRQEVFPVTEDGKLVGYVTTSMIRDLATYHRNVRREDSPRVHRESPVFIDVG